jgi:hypothetical protein
MRRNTSVIGILLLVIFLMALTPAQSVMQSGSSAFEGTVRGKPKRQLILPAPDKPGHILGLSETEGSFDSGQNSIFLKGASVSTVEMWDFVNGNGSEKGFITFVTGNNRLVANYSGSVKQETGGRSSLDGKMDFIAGTGALEGIKGTATYTGVADRESFKLRISGRYMK